jgi:MFS family permease
VLVAADLLAVWHLLLFALLTGVCYALDVPARQAMLPDLVPRGPVNAIA